MEAWWLAGDGAPVGRPDAPAPAPSPLTPSAQAASGVAPTAPAPSPLAPSGPALPSRRSLRAAPTWDASPVMLAGAGAQLVAGAALLPGLLLARDGLRGDAVLVLGVAGWTLAVGVAVGAWVAMAAWLRADPAAARRPALAVGAANGLGALVTTATGVVALAGGGTHSGWFAAQAGAGALLLVLIAIAWRGIWLGVKGRGPVGAPTGWWRR